MKAITPDQVLAVVRARLGKPALTSDQPAATRQP
jgi:hypothetical protein